MASVWDELKRRNVVRVAVAYAVIAWLLLQVADVVLNNIESPSWVFQTILLLLVIGFPLALIFAWAFELTPEGIKKEKDVDEGIRWLERAYAERSPWIGYMRVDPRLDPLRSDSRFDALLRQARLN